MLLLLKLGKSQQSYVTKSKVENVLQLYHTIIKAKEPAFPVGDVDNLQTKVNSFAGRGSSAQLAEYRMCLTACGMYRTS